MSKFHLVGEINDEMIKNLLEILADSGPISIDLYSGGGDLTTGLAMADLISAHGRVSITATGFVGSAAVAVLASAAKRSIRPSAAIYLHPPTHMGEHTTQTLIASTENFRREIELYVAKISKTSKLTKDEVMSYISKDTYLDAEQSVRLGLVDFTQEEF